ncbi:MAG: SPOR domain-containing protein [Spirochaetia bacterium]|nr:SPOR domain-containing protein [Spirochaetia bacterium]
MEQQKLLWTILSVGILVLIILGAGMFFFLPSDSTGLAQNGKTTEWSKAASPAPEQKAPDVKKTPVQPAAPTPAPKPEIKKTPVQTAQTPAPAPKPEVKKTPVQTTPAPTPAPKATPAPATKPATTTTPKATPAPTTKPATTAQQTTKPAQTQAAKPAQTQQAKPAAATTAKGSYWVQVGSYATTDAAEKTKKDLAAKGYTSSIQSITANGKTYHRVKIGPYASRADVDTLLPKIKALPGMGDSFITTK